MEKELNIINQRKKNITYNKGQPRKRSINEATITTSLLTLNMQNATHATLYTNTILNTTHSPPEETNKKKLHWWKLL